MPRSCKSKWSAAPNRCGLWALLALWTALAGCRTTTVRPTGVIGSETTDSQVQGSPASAAVKPSKPSLLPQPLVLKIAHGFDLGGPISCLPLAAEHRCLKRADALAAACQTAGGQLSRCDDCSSICSVVPLATAVP